MEFVYSTQPYRRKYFILSNSLLTDKTVIFNSVRHLIIYDKRILKNCCKRFPYVNKLTLNQHCSLHSKWYASDECHSIFPLTQITQLDILIGYQNFAEIDDLLHWMPNVHTLTVSGIKLSIEERQISKQNQIKQLTIFDFCSVQMFKFLMDYFPRMLHFTLNMHSSSLAFDEFLPSLPLTSPHPLSSLTLQKMEEKKIDKLKTSLESKLSPNQYSIDIINDIFYLWW